jgi:hypothetical protein
VDRQRSGDVGVHMADIGSAARLIYSGEGEISATRSAPSSIRSPYNSSLSSVTTQTCSYDSWSCGQAWSGAIGKRGEHRARHCLLG